MWKSITAITLGAALGALLRWLFNLKLNNLFPDIPPGTLFANLVGSFIIGLAIAYFADAPAISPAWKLFIITGFCGGLTTFSSFSAEVLTLLQQGKVALSLGAIGAHLFGSLFMTFAGVASLYLLKHLLD
ncbi:MAG: fluoride efflux transporter CrcB [Tatlockia sp.]|nr:fluoride efflux transporter CrcB [Tatlockia sp.]